MLEGEGPPNWLRQLLHPSYTPTLLTGRAGQEHADLALLHPKEAQLKERKFKVIQGTKRTRSEAEHTVILIYFDCPRFARVEL